MDLTLFKEKNILDAVKDLFEELNVPINYIAEEPIKPQEILKETYKNNASFKLINNVYFVGMVDDAAFEGNKSLTADKIKSDYDGILIFAITLHQRENNLLPTRSQLAEISRAFNREFYYTPVVVVFKYSSGSKEYISFANTERLKYKQEWREGEKAGKVSLLRDVDIQNPHTGHLKILEELKIPTSGNKAIDSFDKLYKYWQEVFSVNILNKKFYLELQNWYFWAVSKVKFPTSIKNNGKIKNFLSDDKSDKSINIIRLLTRLIFIWFLKEKSLVPSKLFDNNFIGTIIKNFNEKNSSNYYKAILQNLFFATLNAEMNKDKPNNRRFVESESSFENNKAEYGIKTLYRYSELFLLPKEEAIKLFEDIPFLNGGLFDCLDKEDEDTNKVMYFDGFTRNKRLQPIVPDELFFNKGTIIDLSTEYDDLRKNKIYVSGLFNILYKYKFTVEENTPLEEEVALDPELLGRVFENLLAEYNPETKSTARKKTGSYYTPREIVNYMVDQSLTYYLKDKLISALESKTKLQITESEKDLFGKYDNDEIKFEPKKTTLSEKAKNEIEERIIDLISYSEKVPDFNEGERKILIDAIESMKIIDPAVGSGAFPMGVLHKLVHILHKLDYHNLLWKEAQIRQAEKITAPEVKKETLEYIEEIFDEQNNFADFSRKLYLIQKCIYGVDIQPIAVQIAKLRFFISLLIDQKVVESKPNRGIHSLPNMETKIVAANSLIKIDTELGGLFEQVLRAKENELKKIRESYFNAKTRKEKSDIIKNDLKIRNELKELLIKAEVDSIKADMLVKWNPYNQNFSAPFFDPEWMFGIYKGFDIVIGNPPYVRADSGEEYLKFRKNLLASKQYETLWEKWDLYIPFMERGFTILNEKGIITFIIPSAYLTSKYALKSRRFFIKNSRIDRIDFLMDLDVFDATVKNIIFQFSKSDFSNYKPKRLKHTGYFGNITEFETDFQISLKENVFNEKLKKEIKFDNIVDWGQIFYVSYGLRPNADEKISQGLFKKSDLICETQDAIHSKKYIEGKDIKAYKLDKIRYLEWGTERCPKMIARPTFEELYSFPKIMQGGMTGAIIDETGIVSNHSITISTFWYNLKNVQNRSINNSVAKDFKVRGKKAIALKREVLNEISKNFEIKYCLSILNSKFANWFFNQVRRSAIGLYPDDIKKLPIKVIPKSEQSVFVILVDIVITVKANHKKNIRTVFEDAIDAMVFNLYFPDHMKERGINVLEFVEQDINEVINPSAFGISPSKGKKFIDFEQLSDTPKEEVIEKLHKKWTDPENEVVKRMSMFKEKSPDILKVIMES